MREMWMMAPVLFQWFPAGPCGYGIREKQNSHSRGGSVPGRGCVFLAGHPELHGMELPL